MKITDEMVEAAARVLANDLVEIGLTSESPIASADGKTMPLWETYLDLAHAALAAALAVQTKQGTEVKKLEWKQAIRGGSYVAHAIWSLYAIDQDHECAILAKHEGSSILKSAHHSVDEAKAAAQSDYEARIRSALVDVPAVESEPVVNVIPSWKDQAAFEEWAATERYEMQQHPLHYLFLDAKTAAARKGWKAGMAFALSTRKGSAGDGAATITKGNDDE